MKNILSSLNESEKRRILEMYYKGSAKRYLAEQKIYKEGTYSYKVENNKYYYSTDDGKTWAEQTKPEGIKAIKAVIEKQGGTVDQKPQTPPGNPSAYSTPGFYQSIKAPSGISIGVNNMEYQKKEMTDLSGSGTVRLAGQNQKTGRWDIDYGYVSCNTGQIGGNYKPLGTSYEVVEFVSNNFCGEDIAKRGRMMSSEPKANLSTGETPMKTVWKRKNEDFAQWKSRWYTDSLADISCSSKKVTFTDKYKNEPFFKDISDKDLKAMETALLTVCS